MKLLIKNILLQTKIQWLFIKNQKTVAILILLTIIFTSTMNVNITECMPTPQEKVSQIVTELQEDNPEAAQQLLHRLANENLTANQIEELDLLINQELQQHPANIYGIHQGNLHNAGNPVSSSENDSIRLFTWRDIALALTVAMMFTISLYLVYRYWDDIRNVLFGSSRTISIIARTVTNPVQIALIRRLELVPTHQITPRFLQLASIIITRNNIKIEE